MWVFLTLSVLTTAILPINCNEPYTHSFREQYRTALKDKRHLQSIDENNFHYSWLQSAETFFDKSADTVDALHKIETDLTEKLLKHLDDIKPAPSPHEARLEVPAVPSVQTCADLAKLKKSVTSIVNGITKQAEEKLFGTEYAQLIAAITNKNTKFDSETVNSLLYEMRDTIEKTNSNLVILTNFNHNVDLDNFLEDWNSIKSEIELFSTKSGVSNHLYEQYNEKLEHEIVEDFKRECNNLDHPVRSAKDMAENTEKVYSKMIKLIKSIFNVEETTGTAKTTINRLIPFNDAHGRLFTATQRLLDNFPEDGLWQELIESIEEIFRILFNVAFEYNSMRERIDNDVFKIPIEEMKSKDGKVIVAKETGVGKTFNENTKHIVNTIEMAYKQIYRLCCGDETIKIIELLEKQESPIPNLAVVTRDDIRLIWKQLSQTYHAVQKNSNEFDTKILSGILNGIHLKLDELKSGSPREMALYSNLYIDETFNGLNNYAFTSLSTFYKEVITAATDIWNNQRKFITQVFIPKLTEHNRAGTSNDFTNLINQKLRIAGDKSEPLYQFLDNLRKLVERNSNIYNIVNSISVGLKGPHYDGPYISERVENEIIFVLPSDEVVTEILDTVEAIKNGFSSFEAALGPFEVHSDEVKALQETLNRLDKNALMRIDPKIMEHVSQTLISVDKLHGELLHHFIDFSLTDFAKQNILIRNTCDDFPINRKMEEKSFFEVADQIRREGLNKLRESFEPIDGLMDKMHDKMVPLEKLQLNLFVEVDETLSGRKHDKRKNISPLPTERDKFQIDRVDNRIPRTASFRAASFHSNSEVSAIMDLPPAVSVTFRPAYVENDDGYSPIGIRRRPSIDTQNIGNLTPLTIRPKRTSLNASPADSVGRKTFLTVDNRSSRPSSRGSERPQSVRSSLSRRRPKLKPSHVSELQQAKDRAGVRISMDSDLYRTSSKHSKSPIAGPSGTAELASKKHESPTSSKISPILSTSIQIPHIVVGKGKAPANPVDQTVQRKTEEPKSPTSLTSPTSPTSPTSQTSPTSPTSPKSPSTKSPRNVPPTPPISTPPQPFPQMNVESSNQGNRASPSNSNASSGLCNCVPGRHTCNTM